MNTQIDPFLELKTRVEDLGVVFEKFGRTPVSGRVFAYLLVADPPEKTFDDIVKFLEASKSSVSVALKSLQIEGTVSYKTYSGDRKKYFRVDTNGWYINLRDSAKNLSDFNVLLSQVLEYRRDYDSKDFNDDIKSLLDFQVYLSDEIKKAVARWKK